MKKDVNHYLNDADYSSFLFNSAQPSLGLRNTKVKLVDDRLTCDFERDNFNSMPGYINITSSSKLYLLIAYGPSSFSYHGPNRMVSKYPVEFDMITDLSDFTTTAEEEKEGEFTYLTQTMSLYDVSISWRSKEDKTEFFISSPLGNGVNVNNAWLGIGLNKEPRMVKLIYSKSFV
jgi:hypothetical protein